MGLAFDEAAVLRDNLQYLVNSLDLDSIEVQYTDSAGAPEKNREECAPGRPHLTARASPALTVRLGNPTPRSGLFSAGVRLAPGDSVVKLKTKLAKEVKVIKDMNNVKIWRYKDPVLGPRKIPVIDDYLTKCVVLDDGAVFAVDVDGNKVAVVVGSWQVP